MQPRRGTARDHPGVQRKPAGKDVLLAAADAHTAGGSARTNALYAGIVEDRVDREPATQNALDAAVVDGAIEIRASDVLDAASLDKRATGRAVGSDLLSAAGPNHGAVGRSAGLNKLHAAVDRDVTAAFARRHGGAAAAADDWPFRERDLRAGVELRTAQQEMSRHRPKEIVEIQVIVFAGFENIERRP